MFCTPQGTPVSQMLEAREPGATSKLADVVKYVITLLRTGLLEAACLIRMHTEEKSAELCIGGPSMKRSQPVHGYSFVPIECNSRCLRVRVVKALGTPVEAGSIVA